MRQPVTEFIRGRLPKVRPGRTVRGYRIGPLLGAGGYFRTYAAVYVPTGTRVAFRVCRKDFVAQRRFEVNFFAEAEYLAFLTAADVIGVCRLHDYALADNTGFIATERIARENILYRVIRQGEVSPEQALRWAEDLAATLGKLEELGESAGVDLMHLDLKPANIGITRRGWTRAFDFAFGGRYRNSLLREGDVFGTPGYMSRQRIKGEIPDPRDDMFALGRSLWEMLRREAPPSGAVTTSTTRTSSTEKSARYRCVPVEVDVSLPIGPIGREVLTMMMAEEISPGWVFTIVRVIKNATWWITIQIT